MATQTVDRQKTVPFLLRLFYKSNSFHRLDDFTTTRLPQHLQIYTWQDCTLRELTTLLLSALPSLLPPQYAGTRVAFRLVYADTQAPSRPGSAARFISRDLGSAIVGAQGVDTLNEQDDDTQMEDGGEVVNVKEALKQLNGELDKTLSDAKFVIGDYICASILAPGPDGSVAAAPPPPSGPSARGPPLRDGYSGRGGRENGFGGRGDFAYGGRGGGNRGGRFDDRRGGGLPSGEWRRGEAPPEREGYWRGSGGGGGGGGREPRGRGRGGGRW